MLRVRTTSITLLAILSNAAQDALGLVCCGGALLASVQLACKDTHVLLCKAVLQSVGPWHVQVHGLVAP